MLYTLVIGSNGYIGNALTQRLLKEGKHVIGIDNDIKKNWLKEMNSESAIPVLNGIDRLHKLKKLGKYTYYNIDISLDVNKLTEIFKKYDFDTIINLAQMPSAPYSHVDLNHATFTIQNNTIGTLNLAFIMKEYCPNAHIIEIESMGTYNHGINVPIPEGKFQMNIDGRLSEPCIFPKQPGSYYHCSKVFNTYILDCAYRWWGIRSTTINQGVVYGNWTPEIEESGLNSFLAYDSTFGTVVNRFIVQSKVDIPLTIYGKGDQKRGYLALNDSIQCLMLFINNPSNDFRIVNQFAEVLSVNDIANKIKKINKSTKFNYMETPRCEDTEDFYYNVDTSTLKNLGFKNTRTIDNELEYVYNKINSNNINLNKEEFIKW